MTSVSKNIKRLRNEAGMSQETLAEKLSVTRQTVSSWETGRTQPDLETLAAIGEALGSDVTGLIYGKNRRRP
jgi:transcriptional regulator with XRE-family HTH domain